MPFLAGWLYPGCLSLLFCFSVAASPKRFSPLPDTQGTVLIATDFGGANRPVSPVANPRTGWSVTGVLPAGWQESSGRVEAALRPLRESNRGFLRAQITQVEEGRFQIVHPLAGREGERFYRLSLELRSLDRLPIQLGLRTRDRPLGFAWKSETVAEPGWRKREWVFRAEAPAVPMVFYLHTDRPGRLDLARLELREILPGTDTAAGENRNLARNSRFPLGLQSGWALRAASEAMEEVARPDTNLRGPSGFPALRLRAAEPITLTTAPVAIEQFQKPHTASLYLQGEGKGTLRVVCEGKSLASVEFELDGRPVWRRWQVTFAPLRFGRAHALRLEGRGHFWLDALQIEPGDAATPYQSGQVCEVALAGANPLRFLFEDEPPQVQVCVTGQTRGAVLRGRVVNLYGESASLPPRRLTGASLETWFWRFDRFGHRPFGPHRIEAWVEDGQGRKLSAPNELVLYRLRRPRYWLQDAPQSAFGAHLAPSPSQILFAKALGINWVRLHDNNELNGWYHLERQPGVWTFRDAEIFRYRRYGLKLLGMLATAPEWASYLETPQNPYWDQFYLPRRIEEYARYARTLLSRYRGVIDAYDVWNEPWYAPWFGVGYDESQGKGVGQGYRTPANPQARFVELQRAAYQAARAVDPNIVILGINSQTEEGGAGSFGQMIGGAEWTREVVAQGGLAACDAICYHQYMDGHAGFPGDPVERGLQQATTGVPRKDGRLPLPVWMTEGSPQIGSTMPPLGSGFYRHTLPYGETEDVVDVGNRLCRYVVAQRGNGVAKIFLYTMNGSGYFGEASSWRILLTEEGFLHPSAAAYSAMTWHLEGLEPWKIAPVTKAVTAYLFAGKGRSVAVLAKRPGLAPYPLPRYADLAVTDLYGNPLPANALLGDTLVYLTLEGTPEKLEGLLRSGPQE